MIQVDGPFNTNEIRMPLIDCLGISNTGKSSFFTFYFVTSEILFLCAKRQKCTGQVMMQTPLGTGTKWIERYSASRLCQSASWQDLQDSLTCQPQETNSAA